MRKVPLKNYFILFFVIIVICLITFFIANVYKQKIIKNSSMHNYISKITEKELTDYIIERPMIFMYVSNPNDLTDDKFEKHFVKYINKNNLKDYFVYINSSDLTYEFTNFFKENYKLNINLNQTPFLITINDGNVEQVDYINVNNYNVEELINFEVIK